MKSIRIFNLLLSMDQWFGQFSAVFAFWQVYSKRKDIRVNETSSKTARLCSVNEKLLLLFVKRIAKL